MRMVTRHDCQFRTGEDEDQQARLTARRVVVPFVVFVLEAPVTSNLVSTLTVAHNSSRHSRRSA
jgi:hypothetical protein